MTTIETQSIGHGTTIRVHGELTNEQVAQLERCWRKNSTTAQPLHLDLCDVPKIDAAGKCLVSRMFAEGVELVVKSRRRR